MLSQLTYYENSTIRIEVKLNRVQVNICFFLEDKGDRTKGTSPQGAGKDLSIVTTQKLTCRGGHLLPAFSFCPDNKSW